MCGRRICPETVPWEEDDPDWRVSPETETTRECETGGSDPGTVARAPNWPEVQSCQLASYMYCSTCQGSFNEHDRKRQPSHRWILVGYWLRWGLGIQVPKIQADGSTLLKGGPGQQKHITKIHIMGGCQTLEIYWKHFGVTGYRKNCS